MTTSRISLSSGFMLQLRYVSLNLYVCLFTFTPKFNMLPSSFQNILSLLHHYTAMSQREEALKAEIAEWDQALQTATSLAEITSKQQNDKIEKLETFVKNMKDAKEVAEGEVQKEKTRADKAVQAVRILQKSLEMAKHTEEEYKRPTLILRLGSTLSKSK